MAQSQLTQCPHCKASFKVSDEQLNAANGRVRCGACLNIFDAIAYRLSSDKENQQAIQKNINTQEIEEEHNFTFDAHDSIDLEDSLLDKSSEQEQTTAYDLEDDISLFADDPEEDKQEKGYSGPSKFRNEFSTSFLELEKSSKDNFKTQFVSEDLNELENKDDVDESWTASILDDLEEPENSRKEPGFSTEIESDEQEIASAPPAQPAQPITPPTVPFTQNELNQFRFEYDQDRSPRFAWLGKLFWITLNTGLIIILLAQASWFHYDKLARYSNIAELYALACNKLGCTLPVLQDISKIDNRNLVVRSHPTVFNALIIETIITNHAGYNQPYPDISLSFSNINNKIIAQRLFSPSEYLNKEMFNKEAMPDAQPIQITLEIIDPGSDAVNYKLNFHTSRDTSLEQKTDQLSIKQSKI